MYQHLRSNGYYIEVLGQSYTCFDAKHYGTLLIVDPEEEFFKEEIDKLYRDFQNGLSLIIFADWYNVTVMKKVKFFDENTRQWWLPVTGGANIPALNELLSPWGIALGDQIFEGDFKVGSHDMYYASGASIIEYPSQNFTLLRENLFDQGQELLHNKRLHITNVPILGLYGAFLSAKQTTDNFTKSSGQMAIYGDSNCLDSAHQQKDCFWMLDALLQFTTTGQKPSFMSEAVVDKSENQLSSNATEGIKSHSRPQRMEGNQLFKYSKVIDEQSKKRPLVSCLSLPFEDAIPLNTTAPSSLFKAQKLLSLEIGDSKLLDAPFIQNSGETSNLDDESAKDEAFEHYDALSWSNSRMANLFSGSKLLRVRSESEVNYSLYTLLMVCTIILVMVYLAKHKFFISRGRKRRPRTTLYRLLRQGPLRTTGV